MRHAFFGEANEIFQIPTSSFESLKKVTLAAEGRYCGGRLVEQNKLRSSTPERARHSGEDDPRMSCRLQSQKAQRMSTPDPSSAPEPPLHPFQEARVSPIGKRSALAMHRKCCKGTLPTQLQSTRPIINIALYPNVAGTGSRNSSMQRSN